MCKFIEGWPTKLVPKDGGNSIDLLNIISDTVAEYGKSLYDGNWSLEVNEQDGIYTSTSYMEHLNQRKWEVREEEDGT